MAIGRSPISSSIGTTNNQPSNAHLEGNDPRIHLPSR
jgi:hypothetical protein